ncbi:recombinase family protein, partial [Propioniciclava flava]|uniref:recombinase family protein n=1 Tax=Propioniciclava flava TaxID=2072026 RepID=UPI0019D64B95
MNLKQVRRCVLYARLSVTKEESVSIARQLQSCRRYAEARGWEVVGEFVDDGVSATANRPEERLGWKSLLAARDFDAVIIWKVDRLARRVLDFLHADETLQQRSAGGLTPFRRSSRYESRPVARGRGQGDWSDHDEQQEASHPGAGRP